MPVCISIKDGPYKHSPQVPIIKEGRDPAQQRARVSAQGGAEGLEGLCVGGGVAF